MLEKSDGEELGAALVRFHNAKECAASASITEVCGTTVAVEVASGDVETAYGKRLENALAAKRTRENEPSVPKVKMVPGSLIAVRGLPEHCSPTDLKTAFSAKHNVRYAEMPCGDDEDSPALVRFHSASDASASLDITEVNGALVRVEIATGEIESGFWTRLNEVMRAAALKRHEEGGGHRRGGGGGSGYGSNRRGGRRGGRGGRR